MGCSFILARWRTGIRWAIKSRGPRIHWMKGIIGFVTTTVCKLHRADDYVKKLCSCCVWVRIFAQHEQTLLLVTLLQLRSLIKFESEGPCFAFRPFFDQSDAERSEI